MLTLLRVWCVVLGVCGSLFGGCATLQFSESVDVNLAGISPLQGAGLEFRMLLKMRIQNPNDAPLDYTGVSIRMDVQGKRFATGVSDASGRIPRFGEVVVEIPVSVSMLGIARQALGFVGNENSGKLAYEIRGRLAGPLIEGVRFSSQGELSLPAEFFERGR